MAYLAAIVFLPTITLAAAPKTLKELANLLVTILNSATALLVFAALVMFLLGASLNIWKSNERGGKVLTTYLMWGILTLFVMVSIWGILRLLQGTLFENSPYNPTTGGANTNGTTQNTGPRPTFPAAQGFE